jgi:hypothetical protein
VLVLFFNALAFPCRRILGGWINARTQERIDPTHWRRWGGVLLVTIESNALIRGDERANVPSC